ncbi:hypothetical protein JH06_0485 [Blastocystis sp. subtype 4]|uniref:hypothetical protein n=1 Tax=Blastocystis sp. subtype 4 TaxID=944170 RepID=UPI000711304D|nr:hypothetical protein JH06_0485 [Blastocystis sp. subtype 4]KNB45874.1 hypothetical protein JH06_0485 [Blastocystis sp. subtype 4]|eukprot:XP_014529317.1 hypothetical protein JH06_0485 [Blastocystis sp. subtype 4]
MASLFETIEKGLESWGFDLCQPFESTLIEDYNENVSGIYKIPSMGRENTLAVLVGNSRNIWEHFIERLAEDESLYKEDNPLDAYTKMAIQSVVAKLHVRTCVYYTCDSRTVPFLDYQLIAESYYSKMCYHHKYGHWIGLRAVIVLDHTYIYNLSSKHMVDFEICKKCDLKYGEMLDELCKDKEMMNRYRDPATWRSWLALRTICTHNQYNYTYEEACYHYSKNRRVLESEVQRYRQGTFKPNYDWLEAYNRDPEHYRVNDF